MTYACLTALPSPRTDGCRLNLELRRDFTWRLVFVHVSQPLLEADFLSYFVLLVDCRTNHLLDGVTSLSAPAQVASSQIPGVKFISGDTLGTLRISGPHSPHRSPARGSPQQRPLHQDYTSHQPTTTGTGLASHCQSRVRRHVAGLHSPPLPEGLPGENSVAYEERPLSGLTRRFRETFSV
jgi:hypothetical protein